MVAKWHDFIERFWVVDKRNIGIVCGLSLMQVAACILCIAETAMLSLLIDYILPDFSINKLAVWFGVSIAVVLGNRIFDGLFQGYLYFKYEILLTKNAIEKVLSQIMKKEIYEVDRYNEGYLMNLTFNDAVTMVSVSVQLLIQIPSTTVSICLTLLLLWQIAPLLCVVEIILIPMYIFSSLFFRKKLEQLQVKQREKKDILDSGILNILNHVKAVKLTGKSQYFLDYVSRIYVPYIEHVLKYWSQYFWAKELPGFIVKMGNVIMLVCGVVLYLRNDISLGILVLAGNIGSILLGQVNELLARILRRVANGESFSRIDGFSLQREDIGIEKYETKESEHIVIKNADMYMEKNSLYHISEFRAGEPGIIMIKGANGTGKSTLLNWITKVISCENMQTASHSTIQIPQSLLADIVYLSSPNILIEETVRENILLGSGQTDIDSRLKEVLRIDFMEKMVTIKPVNLSFGEQQKIYLARVLNGDSHYILLDEPTTNLDIETKKRLIQYLCNLSKEKCIILIGHEEELEEKATKIYCISNDVLLCE